MWFFGCGSRKTSSTGCSSSRYPSNVNAYTTQQYYPTGIVSPTYYFAPGYTYTVPPPRYVVPQAATRNPHYGYAPAPPPYVPPKRSGTVRISQGPAKSQATATSGSRVTSGSATSGRKVTFGRVDVREFSEGAEVAGLD